MKGFLKFYTFFMEDTTLTFKLLLWRFKCNFINLSFFLPVWVLCRWRLKEQNLSNHFKPIQGMDLGQEEEMLVVATMLVVVECMQHTLREQLMEAWVAEEAM
jgi:hypothetical protein